MGAPGLGCPWLGCRGAGEGGKRALTPSWGPGTAALLWHRVRLPQALLLSPARLDGVTLPVPCLSPLSPPCPAPWLCLPRAAPCLEPNPQLPSQSLPPQPWALRGCWDGSNQRQRLPSHPPAAPCTAHPDPSHGISKPIHQLQDFCTPPPLPSWHRQKQVPIYSPPPQKTSSPPFQQHQRAQEEPSPHPQPTCPLESHRGAHSWAQPVPARSPCPASPTAKGTRNSLLLPGQGGGQAGSVGAGLGVGAVGSLFF